MCQCSGVSESQTNPEETLDRLGVESAHDLAVLSAHEILSRYIVDLMTDSAVKMGLYEGGEEHRDLADARVLIDGLAGLIDGAAPHLGSQHAGPLRAGLQQLQQAFAELSPIPDPPGTGPGERFAGGSGRRPRR